jgi:hypothetical protein
MITVLLEKTTISNKTVITTYGNNSLKKTISAI